MMLIASTIQEKSTELTRQRLMYKIPQGNTIFKIETPAEYNRFTTDLSLFIILEKHNSS